VLPFNSSCTCKRRLRQTRLMPVMPWRTICAATLIGVCVSSACCAKRNCLASYARRGLHQSSVTLSSATFIQDSYRRSWRKKVKKGLAIFLVDATRCKAAVAAPSRTGSVTTLRKLNCKEWHLFWALWQEVRHCHHFPLVEPC